MQAVARVDPGAKVAPAEQVVKVELAAAAKAALELQMLATPVQKTLLLRAATACTLS